MNWHIGTSGYSYKEWKGPFYPEKIAAGDMLASYAGRLPSVEINNTFYRMPKASVLETWAEQVPDTFRFAIKASRRITHLKRLKEVDEDATYLLDSLDALDDRLGVVLYQFPPNFRKDVERLKRFMNALYPDIRSAFEFRHESWFDDEIFDVLREHGCALCVADVEDQPEPEIVSTADFGYLRLRRPSYTKADLKRWHQEIAGQDWGDVFIFFKHEDEATGPHLAMQLLALATARPR